MQVWRNPVVQFVAAGFLMLAVLAVGAGVLSRHAATEEAIGDARATTEVLATSVAQPAISRGLVAGNAAAVDRFDRAMLRRLLVGDVHRVKIWDADGTIVYSDEVRLIGERFALQEDEQHILRSGGSDAEVTDLSKPENRYESESSHLLEVYTRVRAPGGEPLLFEAYFPYDDVTRRSKDVLADFRPITLGGLALFLGLTTPLVWLLARRLDRSARERERLLRAAADASDAERRRIARDLHDGVVQDLAGTSFALSATARELEHSPAVAGRLEALGEKVRQSLRTLRSLLVEIYPPELGTEGLSAALTDLVAPAAADGVATTVRVDDTSRVPATVVALVWRVAQEAVRNALRHGRPDRLDVVVAVRDDRVVLEVVDNGSGFDPARLPPDGHFGLRGMRDLIAEAGGTLTVTSAPGHGATIRLEVASR